MMHLSDLLGLSCCKKYTRRLLWGVLAVGAGLFGGCATAPAPKETISVPVAKSVSSTLDASVAGDYARAQDFMKAGNWAKATPLLAEAARKSPGFAPVWIHYGQALLAEDDPANAAKAIDHARGLAPKDAALLNIAGVIYAEAGHFKKAEAAHSEAVVINPNCGECHYNLGRFYDIYHQNLSAAIRHYEAYLNLSGETDEELSAWVDELKRNQAR